MRKYAPRRAPKRFLDEDCPLEVLAIYDNGGKTWDRYTVIYNDVSHITGGNLWVWYRGMSENPMSPSGFGISGEMNIWDLKAYRRRAYREYASWSSLPDEVKSCVQRDCELIRGEQEL
ncbi:hypothetical protein HWB24_gp09 [Rhodococcus phage Hiro]|uniref:Uncharacterized protein n=1 Tax=Rhodococcus phage Hiro TaxID=2015828 RepID=A0A222ZHP8_9CAUD|nr:hypothetical protein HWB24_gp09 [Rhodococcus phage Hiro]ASR84246.1 hypothetical protein SEA_HIRO_63 [Rhodococcus phage Hiro]